MGPFVRRRGAIEARLAAVEGEAVRRVAEEMLEALGAPGHEQLRRLFPPAYEDDAERQEEFARMTRDDLVGFKRAAARAVIDSIDRGTKKDRTIVTLDEDTARAWLSVLNDARLVLGTRLDVTEDMDHDPLPADHPDAPAHNMYIYLGGLQWALVETMLDDLPQTGTGE